MQEETSNAWKNSLTNGSNRNFQKISPAFIDALTTAYCEVAPKKLADQVRPIDPSSS